jgi:hypothetical protein
MEESALALTIDGLGWTCDSASRSAMQFGRSVQSLKVLEDLQCPSPHVSMYAGSEGRPVAIIGEKPADAGG